MPHATPRTRRLASFLVLLSVSALAMRQSDEKTAAGLPRGFELVAMVASPSSGPVPAVLNQPSSVLFRLDENGLPIVSTAGFVHLKQEGEGFFYANMLPNRRKNSERRGDFDTDNWGDVDAFRLLGRVVKRWRASHENGPRVGIEDISSEFGGFGDYDKDGAADHRTHQLGSHLNILIPSTVVPEIEIHFGLRNEDKYDAAGTQMLVRALFEEGAWSVTTTSATRLLEQPETFPMPFELITKPDAETAVYLVDGRHKVVLMKAARNHGNIFNARLSPIW